MTYVKNTWANGAAGGRWAPGATALKASWFQNMEDGIEAGDTRIYNVLSSRYSHTGAGTVADPFVPDMDAVIDDIIAAGRGIAFFPPGIFQAAIDIPPGAFVALRGSGKGATGGWVGTRLVRSSGVVPVVSATGTGQSSSQRAILEISDMELSANGSAGDVLAVSRASHLDIRNVRVANNQGGTGVHLTEIWDSTINGLWVERCGSGTTSPAMLMDSVVSAGADANVATVQISNITFQSNYGTDWKLSGSAADSSPTNDVEVVNVKMEGTGTGTSGTPDTYPYIDLAYAQNCQFTNVRISQPTGRAATFIQQTGTSPGPRANLFTNTVLDVAGSNTPARYVDQSVGTLLFHNISWPSTQPSSEYVRIQSSVAAGRFRITGINHNSANVTSGFITDSRTTQEEQNKGRIVVPIMSSDGTLTTIGDNAVWGLADAVDQYVRGQVVLPRDVDATAKAYIRVYWTASTTGNVQWSWHQTALSAGGNLSTAGTQVDQNIASPGANLLAVSSWSGSAGVSVSPGQLVTVRVGRKGSHANDTVTGGTVYVVGVELYYDRRT